MDYRKFVYIGGVPASGKTTVGSLTAKRIGGIYISSGEIKRPEAWRRFGKNLSSLDQEDSFQINDWFFKGLSAKKEGGLYLIDTHYTYPLKGDGFVNLLPERRAWEINLFILFESNPPTILSRRINRGRDRDSINEDFIRKEIEKEREEAMRLSRMVSAPLRVVENVGSVDESIDCLGGYLI